MMAIFLVYYASNMVVMLDELPILPEGTEVQVAVIPPGNEESTLGSRLMKSAGKLEGLPSDFARNHDHYLHGAPTS